MRSQLKTIPALYAKNSDGLSVPGVAGDSAELVGLIPDSDYKLQLLVRQTTMNAIYMNYFFDNVQVLFTIHRTEVDYTGKRANAHYIFHFSQQSGTPMFIVSRYLDAYLMGNTIIWNPGGGTHMDCRSCEVIFFNDIAYVNTSTPIGSAANLPLLGSTYKVDVLSGSSTLIPTYNTLSIINFKAYLFFGHVYDTGLSTLFSSRVQWSDVGTDTFTGTTAGYTDLKDTPGVILKLVVAGISLYAVKTDSLYEIVASSTGWTYRLLYTFNLSLIRTSIVGTEQGIWALTTTGELVLFGSTKQVFQYPKSWTSLDALIGQYASINIPMLKIMTELNCIVIYAGSYWNPTIGNCLRLIFYDWTSNSWSQTWISDNGVHPFIGGLASIPFSIVTFNTLGYTSADSIFIPATDTGNSGLVGWNPALSTGGITNYLRTRNFPIQNDDMHIWTSAEIDLQGGARILELLVYAQGCNVLLEYSTKSQSGRVWVSMGVKTTPDDNTTLRWFLDLTTKSLWVRLTFSASSTTPTALFMFEGIGIRFLPRKREVVVNNGKGA